MDNLLLDGIAHAAGTEIAFSNGWRYGAPIPAGEITMNDLWNIIPTNPPVSVVDMLGSELWEMMEENLERTYSRNPFEPMGGYVKRCRGINVYCKIENAPGSRIQQFFVDGTPLVGMKKLQIICGVYEMLNPFKKKQWSPYFVGLGIGMLNWFAFATADHPLGITTAFEHSVALIGQAVAPTLADNNEYFVNESPKIGWEWMLVVGVFFGALLSSLLSGDREKIVVPRMWEQRFGPSVVLRLTAALLGGALMMFGARLAQGCTSGHGISGTLQLAASSWIFAILFFGTGIATALLIYGWKGQPHV